MQKIKDNIFVYWEKIKVVFISIIKNPGWKRLFSFDSFLKLLFMYSVILFSIMICYCDFPEKFWEPKKEGEVRIIVFGDAGRMGEYQIYKRTMFGCNKLDNYK